MEKIDGYALGFASRAGDGIADELDLNITAEKNAECIPVDAA